MHVHTEPNVFLMTKQVFNADQFEAFTASEGTSHVLDAATSHADFIPEAAGRLCYMSFGSKAGRKSNHDYIQHILASQHGCYDEETEVLTAHGWKTWDAVTEQDAFATRTADGRLEYHKAKRLIRRQHKGAMYRVTSKGVDLFVTPEHKMLACKTTTRGGRARQAYELVSATDLGTCSHAYIKNAHWDCPAKDHDWLRGMTPRERLANLRLLGFAIGDGYVPRKDHRQVRFRLRRERKIAWLRTTCLDAAVSLTFDGVDRFVVAIERDDVLLRYREMYTEDGEKTIPLCFADYTQEECLAVYEGLMQADGSTGRTGDCFNTTSQALVDQFQHLCLHCGIAANVAHVYGPTERITSFGDKPLTRLSVIRRELRPEVNKYAGCKGKTRWVTSWEGEVFCAEVPNNTLYVRRNGKPVWSGNSVCEHTVFGFLITGVSRTLTHELVRHRLASYSQLSQRYVDSADAGMIIPPAVQQLPHDLRTEVVRQIQEHQQRGLDLYDQLTDTLAAHYATDVKLFDFAVREGLLVCSTRVPGEYYEPGPLLDGVGVGDFCASQDLWVAEIKKNPELRDKLVALTKTARRKSAREAARCVLPNATETKIFVTMNGRALRHFFELRGSVHAEQEIRGLAVKMLRLVAPEAPNIFQDLTIVPLPDGTSRIESNYRKV